ncbi:MAG TPA: hypothetical protein VLF41_03315 [Candidatus Nanoarchaeia archaeon]|nr:hypothetical protein [Candidatus Nanoarchaeia archaeon]
MGPESKSDQNVGTEKSSLEQAADLADQDEARLQAEIDQREADLAVDNDPTSRGPKLEELDNLRAEIKGVQDTAAKYRQSDEEPTDLAA